MRSNGDLHRSQRLEEAWREARHRSPDAIQREIERTQDEIAVTLEEIQARLSPRGIMEDAMSALGAGPGELFANLGRRVRDDPLPVALTGIGLAWLAINDRRDRSGGGGGGRTRDAARGAADRAREVGERARHTGEAAWSRAAEAGQQARRYGADIQEQLQSHYAEHPLVMGALAFAAGAVAGSLIPRSEAEGELLGGAAERVGRAASDAAREGLERAEAAATEAARRGREEAEEASAEGEGRQEGGRESQESVGHASSDPFAGRTPESISGIEPMRPGRTQEAEVTPPPALPPEQIEVEEQARRAGLPPKVEESWSERPET